MPAKASAVQFPIQPTVMKRNLALSLLASALMAAAAYAAPAADNWDNHCAKCHGADGSGNTKIGKKLNVKNYTDATVQADLKDADMFAAIKEGVTANGKERMTAFKDDLSDAEITDLVAFIRQMKK
jgi:mono/diheme cytochrome c family protein